MRTAILIPARYASSRYPGKPLAELRGPDGAKSLLRRSWEAARAVEGGHDVHVLTDDARIAEHAAGFGASVLMTGECANGTERCADALARHGEALGGAELIVNLQGDAPLTPPWFVSALVEAMSGDAGAQVATPVLRCDATAYRHFREDRAAGRVGGTTAVFGAGDDGAGSDGAGSDGAGGRALYFSKEVIPYLPPDREGTDFADVFHHVGLYAYGPGALARYAALPAGPLERHEGLEQLRFLEHGIAVRCVEVEARGRVFWELNNPADVARIEEVLNA
jgi:3-deoxy-manno-octulosonate cytidylyltransferase (CMP-KDO synthetase)